MPKKPDWLRGFYTIDNASGGSSFARGYHETDEVAFTLYGEFSIRYEDEGEVVADFVDAGATCIYTPEGELGFAFVEVSALLSNLDVNELDQMVNRGQNIIDMIAILRGSEQEIFLGFYPKTGEVTTSLETNEETLYHEESVCEDFSEGYGGEITLGYATISYYLKDAGEVFKLYLGEDVTTGDAYGLTIAKRVDLKKFYRLRGQGKPNAFHELAAEIMPDVN